MKRHRAAVGNDHAEDHAEGGGFSRAVAAEQADDFLLGDDKADIIDNGSSAVTLAEFCRFKKIHGIVGFFGRNFHLRAAEDRMQAIIQIVDNLWRSLVQTRLVSVNH